jgi:hypothetical protein
MLFEATPDSVRRLVAGNWVGLPFVFDRLVVSSGSLYGIQTDGIRRYQGGTFVDLGLPGVPALRDLEVVGEDFYLATEAGLSLWREGSSTLLGTFLPPGPRLRRVYSGLGVDSEGVLWAGMSQATNALQSFDGSTWALTLPSSPNGLLDQWILSLFVDVEDGIWLGHCCCPDPEDCPAQIQGASSFTTLGGIQNILDVDQDPSGRIWAASDDFGVEVLSKNILWQRILTLEPGNSGLTIPVTTAVGATATGTYVGSGVGLDYWAHEGTLSFPGNPFDWFHFDVGNGLLDDVVTAISRVGEDVWVGTSTGLHRFRGSSLQGRCPARKRGDSGDPVRAVNTIVGDASGGLWVGTDSGILYLPRGGACDAAGGEFEEITTDNSPLPSDIVVSSALSPTDGSVWFGTDEGILRVDPAGFTGTPPPPDRYVLFPNPIDLRAGSPAGSRRVFFGTEVAGGRPVRTLPEGSGRPEVYDLSGKKVADFDFITGSAGVEWFWDGVNRNGDTVAPGVYLVRATIEGQAVVEKVGVIR